MNQDKKSWLCPMPWLGMGVGGNTYLRLCCNSDESSVILDENQKPLRFSELSSVTDYYNNSFMTNVRQQMLQGEIPAPCTGCAKLEDNKLLSPRLFYMNTYASVMPQLLFRTSLDGQLEPKIQYLDFALGNLCNFKCRMCTPEASAKLAKDWDEINFSYNREHTLLGQSASKIESAFEKLLAENLSTITEIQFTSGEPLLNAHQQKIIETAVSNNHAKNIRLFYFTNLSVLPTKTVQLWKEFKTVYIHVSIDGYGPLKNTFDTDLIGESLKRI